MFDIILVDRIRLVYIVFLKYWQDAALSVVLVTLWCLIMMMMMIFLLS